MVEGLPSQTLGKPSSVADLLANLTEQQTRLMETYKGFLDSMRLETTLHEAKDQLHGLKHAGAKLIELQKEHLTKMLRMLYPIFRVVMPPSQFEEDACIQMLGDKHKLETYDLVELSCVLRCYFAKLAIYVYHLATFVNDRGAYERTVAADPNLKLHKDVLLSMDVPDPLGDANEHAEISQNRALHGSYDFEHVPAQQYGGIMKDKLPKKTAIPQYPPDGYYAAHLSPQFENMVANSRTVTPYDALGEPYVSVNQAHYGGELTGQYIDDECVIRPYLLPTDDLSAVFTDCERIQLAYNAPYGYEYQHQHVPYPSDCREDQPVQHYMWPHDGLRPAPHVSHQSVETRASGWRRGCKGTGYTSVEHGPVGYVPETAHVPLKEATLGYPHDVEDPEEISGRVDDLAQVANSSTKGPSDLCVTQRRFCHTRTFDTASMPLVGTTTRPVAAIGGDTVCPVEESHRVGDHEAKHAALHGDGQPPDTIKPLDRFAMFTHPRSKPETVQQHSTWRENQLSSMHRSAMPVERAEPALPSTERVSRPGFLCCGGVYDSKSKSRHGQMGTQQYVPDAYHPSFYAQRNQVYRHIHVKGDGNEQKDVTYLFYDKPISNDKWESIGTLSVGEDSALADDLYELGEGPHQQPEVRCSASSDDSGCVSEGPLQKVDPSLVTGSGDDLQDQAHPKSHRTRGIGGAQASCVGSIDDNLRVVGGADGAARAEEFIDAVATCLADSLGGSRQDSNHTYEHLPNPGLSNRSDMPKSARRCQNATPGEHVGRNETVETKPECYPTHHAADDAILQGPCLNVQLSQQDIMADQSVESSDRGTKCDNNDLFAFLDPPNVLATNVEPRASDLANCAVCASQRDGMPLQNHEAPALSYPTDAVVAGKKGNELYVMEPAVESPHPSADAQHSSLQRHIVDVVKVSSDYANKSVSDVEPMVEMPCSPKQQGDTILSSSRIPIPPIDMSRLRIKTGS